MCFYEILTGERLFVHAGLTTSADEIYSQPVPVVSKKVPGIPADLDVIMKKALSISPDDRYQTAGEFNEALSRLAHRHGLLIAAPELARELLDTCGPIDQWRDDDGDDDLGYAEGKRAGTEVYDASDDDDAEELEEEDLGIGPVSIHSIALARTKSAERQSRPKTEVGKFAGVELTSIINMMDLESSDGAKPLVDLSAGPRLDSGPRLLDSGPSSLPTPPGGEVPLRAADPMDSVSTAPRRAPPVSQQPPPGMRIAATPGARQSTRGRRGAKSKMPWLIVVLVLLAAGIAAAVVAMSGPDVGEKSETTGKPKPDKN